MKKNIAFFISLMSVSLSGEISIINKAIYDTDLAKVIVLIEKEKIGADLKESLLKQARSTVATCAASKKSAASNSFIKIFDLSRGVIFLAAACYGLTSSLSNLLLAQSDSFAEFIRTFRTESEENIDSSYARVMGDSAIAGLISSVLLYSGLKSIYFGMQGRDDTAALKKYKQAQAIEAYINQLPVVS